MLRRAWVDYLAAYRRFVTGTDHAALEADYFKTMNPLFLATKEAANRILDLNQDAMVRKRDQARRAAERSNAVMIATALLASLIGLVASTVLTNRILRPALCPRTDRATPRGGGHGGPRQGEPPGRDRRRWRATST